MAASIKASKASGSASSEPRKELGKMECDGETLYVDYVMQTDHSTTYITTSHPVQRGAEISDHAYREPDEVTLQIAFNDTAYTGGDNHSANAYTTLREMAEKRMPIKLTTRLKTYENMLITSIAVPDDYTTMFALKATIILKEIIMAEVATLKSGEKTSGSKSKSNKKSENTGTGNGNEKTWKVTLYDQGSAIVKANSKEDALKKALSGKGKFSDTTQKYTGTVTIGGKDYSVKDSKIEKELPTYTYDQKDKPPTNTGTAATTTVGVTTTPKGTLKVTQDMDDKISIPSALS